MKVKTMLVVALLLAVSGLSAQTIVKDKSVVNFEIGNMKVRTVEGTFSGMSGTLHFDANDLSQSYFKVCIDAASVDTDNEKRDAHLRNEDFFEVDKYPTICYTSQSIHRTADGFVSKGVMDMHGVKKSVEIPFTFTNNVFVGHITINRFDYKVGENVKTGMVSAEAHLEIRCTVK